MQYFYGKDISKYMYEKLAFRTNKYEFMIKTCLIMIEIFIFILR